MGGLRLRGGHQVAGTPKQIKKNRGDSGLIKAERKIAKSMAESNLPKRSSNRRGINPKRRKPQLGIEAYASAILGVMDVTRGS